VLAYFGWPRAHEDDTERAVQAALIIGQGADAAQPTDENVVFGIEFSWLTIAGAPEPIPAIDLNQC
jgi:hypothetical protein